MKKGVGTKLTANYNYNDLWTKLLFAKYFLERLILYFYHGNKVSHAHVTSGHIRENCLEKNMNNSHALFKVSNRTSQFKTFPRLIST